jgi:hypothetical protein
MKQNWVLLSAILAILAVPFALAAFEDATTERPSETWGPDVPGASPAPDEIEPEVAGDGVAAFERREPLDLSFLDLLDRGRPVFAASLASAVRLGEPETDGFAAFRDSYQGGPSMQLDRLSDETVAGIRFSFPAEPAVGAALELRWGEPSSSVDGAGAIWLDEESGVRAVLRETTGWWSLGVGQYRPLETLLRLRRDGSLELEPPGLMGASAAELDRHGAVPERAAVRTLQVLPAAASAEPTTSISVVFDGDRVVEVSTTLDLALDPDAPVAAEAILARELGEPSSRARIGDAVELQWARRPELRAFVYPDRLVIDRTPGRTPVPAPRPAR